MLTPGKYSVWFRTSLAEGMGIVALAPEGELSGGDSIMAYAGHWRAEGDTFDATLTATRHSPGSGAFGEVDDLDLTLRGHSSGGVTASCRGTAKQAPDLTLEATLVRIVEG
jgi:hypothetical protein